MSDGDLDYVIEDGQDRRTALHEAVRLVQGVDSPHLFGGNVLRIAEEFYLFLRARESLTPVRLVLTAGPVTDQPGE